jgi:hypothetical protein
MTKPVVIEKAKCFYDETEISDKCTFSDSCLQNFKECHGIRKLDISEVLSADAVRAIRQELPVITLVSTGSNCQSRTSNNPAPVLSNVCQINIIFMYLVDKLHTYPQTL